VKVVASLRSGFFFFDRDAMCIGPCILSNPGKFGPDVGANLKARLMPLPLRDGAEVSLNLALRPGLDPGFGRSTEGAWA